MERSVVARTRDARRLAEIDAALASLRQGRWPDQVVRLFASQGMPLPPIGGAPAPAAAAPGKPVGTAPADATRARNTGLVRAWRARHLGTGAGGAAGPLEPWQRALRSPDPQRRWKGLAWLGQNFGMGMVGASSVGHSDGGGGGGATLELEVGVGVVGAGIG